MSIIFSGDIERRQFEFPDEGAGRGGLEERELLGEVVDAFAGGESVRAGCAGVEILAGCGVGE